MRQGLFLCDQAYCCLKCRNKYDIGGIGSLTSVVEHLLVVLGDENIVSSYCLYLRVNKIGTVLIQPLIEQVPQHLLLDGKAVGTNHMNEAMTAN